MLLGSAAIPCNKMTTTAGRQMYHRIHERLSTFTFCYHNTGGEFHNQAMRAAAEKLGIKVVMSSAYSPETNGKVEVKASSRFKPLLQGAYVYAQRPGAAFIFTTYAK